MDVLLQLLFFALFGSLADFQDVEFKIKVTALGDVRVCESAGGVLFVYVDQADVAEVTTALDDGSLVHDLL
jgi:hypothetical protein